MDTKNTVIAVVLMVALMVGTQFVLGWFFPPTAQTAPAAQAPAAAPSSAVPAAETALAPSAVSEAPEPEPQTITAESDLYKVVFNTKGASVVSFTLNSHKDGTQPLEMVNTTNGGPGAFFELSFGGPSAAPLDKVFTYTALPDNTHEFTRTLVGTDGKPFELKKTYTLVPGEYLIKVKVTIRSGDNTVPQVVQDPKFAYSLTIGPQIGPKFTQIDNSVKEVRKYYWFTGNERKEHWHEVNKTQTYAGSFQWAALMGKYFGAILIPDSGAYTMTWVDRLNANNKAEHGTKMILSRGALKSSATEDTFVVYLGPKDEAILQKYNKASDNTLEFADLKLETSLDRNPLLGWLEMGMKWVMDVLINSWVNNWGVTIIILSLLLRLILWVPTHKSYESTSAMASIGPKMNALQEKYKNDPAKLNQAMAELYKKEGINPLGGCLPMLIQLPIMMALWQMLNTHFDLRGAMFIPGWIEDLSLPDSVFNWGFALPFLNWTDLRLLPILMVVTQIASTMVTQPQSAQANQMKFLTYLLPLVFFFMFYDQPSGLVLYWTVTNVLSMVQQWIINSEIKKKKAAKAGAR